jgi:hypothetical protein
MTAANRINRRPGTLVSCAEFRCHRMDLNIRNIGFAAPLGIENQPVLAN